MGEWERLVQEMGLGSQDAKEHIPAGGDFPDSGFDEVET